MKCKLTGSSFFKQQEFPDLVIKFSDIEITAHRYTVSRKSSWFQKACSGPFQVSPEPSMLGQERCL